MSDDWIGVDLAWREVELALPDGWRINGVDRWIEGWAARAGSPDMTVRGLGASPVAALRALAAQLVDLRARRDVTSSI